MTTTTIATSRFDNMAAALMRAGVLVSRYRVGRGSGLDQVRQVRQDGRRVLIEHSP
jgi:hypothetical protein